MKSAHMSIKVLVYMNYKEENMNKQPKQHGGKRENAGRPPTGRKQRSIWLTDTEHEKVKGFIKQLKELKTHENTKS